MTVAGLPSVENVRLSTSSLGSACLNSSLMSNSVCTMFTKAHNHNYVDVELPIHISQPFTQCPNKFGQSLLWSCPDLASNMNIDMVHQPSTAYANQSQTREMILMPARAHEYKHAKGTATEAPSLENSHMHTYSCKKSFILCKYSNSCPVEVNHGRAQGWSDDLHVECVSEE